jgi:hypothetical protein
MSAIVITGTSGGSPVQKTTVVRAHFLSHKLVQQGVHAQNEVLVLFRVESEIVRLERVVLQVKKIGRRCCADLLERYWRIEA